jgi:hypothetical protein
MKYDPDFKSHFDYVFNGYAGITAPLMIGYGELPSQYIDTR